MCAGRTLTRSVFVSRPLLWLTAPQPCHSRDETRQSNPLCSCNGETALRKPRRKTAALFFLAPMRWPIRRPLSSFGAPFVYCTEPRVRRFASRCKRRFYCRGQRTVRVRGGFGTQTRWRRRDRYSGGACRQHGAVPPARLRCGERNIRTLRSTKD